ncbi:MAG: type III pantothenate kinase [Chloroflexi bacterium]|nr:type III pantothenate kinase [Dehalococcoidia bacterium]PKB81155.1 MAG: pantothenate kinase [SAR202 cluster bacterium MP-SInd-SRR3963457-G1]PKB85823.1 MAG: pantothenate kinase [SAR202 cluster bacterium MP-NPac-SRR3961935-G1]RUA19504.1 MAG: type III pantothenate kinase [Chloroflexota bacterium]RUA30008.1 MAG: type III pantothenate kinase [Chloroflexota bacterium]
MLLAIDIGNSMINLGVFDGERLMANLRVSTDARRSADEYGLTLRDLLILNGVDLSKITDVCMCSVVPPLTGIFEELIQTYFKAIPLTVTAGVKTGLQISYDNPRDVGADRIVDAVAAIELYGQPTIIVDFGTATVFDAVSRDGVYLGGAISPGMNVAAEALFLNTSQLRRVELVAPASAIGQNTTEALQSGLVLGYAGLVTGMVARFKKELGEDAKVVGTGGLANTIADVADVFDAINPDLTLIGLRLIYAKNQPPPKVLD